MRVPRSLAVTCGLVALLSALGCAALLGGGSKQAVSFSSTPGSASFKITSSNGIVMNQGTTPATVTLPRKNEYQVVVSLAGYQDQTIALTKSLNGWVWGNLLCGGILGAIIDFAGGAAYKLEPSQVSVVMVTASVPGQPDEVYVLLRAMDEQGELRALLVPLIPM